MNRFISANLLFSSINSFDSTSDWKHSHKNSFVNSKSYNQLKFVLSAIEIVPLISLTNVMVHCLIILYTI